MLARHVVPELMDDPQLPAAEHQLALRGLQRINSLSATARQIARPMLAFAKREKLQQLSLLDIACGGADVPIGAAHLCQEAGIHVDLNLLDCSATALSLAADAAGRAGISCISRTADLRGDWNDSIYDVVTCSLFLHHLPSGGAVIDVLRKMKNSARRMVIVSDLVRSRAGLAAAWVGGRILSRSPIVHFDAPASVRAAWTIRELREFAAMAGMEYARVEKSFPYRMLLTWHAAL